MKRLIVAAICCLLTFILPTAAYAISAQWDLEPISGDWNTAANWTPMGVPNGPADIATFGLSNTTDVSISADTQVNGITFTSTATNPYTITASPGLTLAISGMGITNNSGTTQHVHINNGGTIAFSNSATAGSNVSIFNDDGGTINFLNASTAGSATIRNFSDGTNFCTTNFFNRSTAGNSTILNQSGSVLFANNSTAGSAFIDLDYNSFLQFANNSTAANSNITTFYNSNVQFLDNSNAGSAFISVLDGTSLQFANASTAGSASIVASGGFISFEGSSRGGTAQIDLRFFFISGSSLDISGHNAPGVTIGSLEGDEFAFVSLGANNLTVGSNHLSTTFAGVISDGFGGSGGSLTKIGTGTLILLGANTYTGNTNVNRGVLQLDGSITSNTFVNHRGTLAGTGTVNGNVMNNDSGIVRPGGSLGAPGVLTVVHNYTQAQYATLMIQIAGMNTGEFSVLNVLGNANLNGYLDPVLLNGFVPAIGETFTFLNYASFSGEFSHIKHRVFDNGMLQWSVIYDSNHAILTVEQHVPDQGSTFLLLTLGLLGLVTFRRQLGCKQA
jgi:autotransporter-associated beta strand protein